MTQQERTKTRQRLQAIYDTFSWLRFFLVTERPSPRELGQMIDHKIELLIALQQAYSEDSGIRRLGEDEVARLRRKEAEHAKL